MCQSRLDLRALLSSGYLPSRIPAGMKINSRHARMRRRAESPGSAAPAARFVLGPFSVSFAGDARCR